MMRVLDLKTSTTTLLLSFVLLFHAQLITAQSKHSIRFISNPIMYKLGDLENQYTIIDNSFVTANYFNKPSQEFGLEYSIGKRTFSFFAGFSWIHQRHRANYIVYHPKENYEWKILKYHDIKLTQNLLGIRIGGEFRINKSISCGLGLSFYSSLQVKSNMSTQSIQYTSSVYSYYSTPDSSYSELSSKLDHKIQRKSPWLIIPDLFITHELSKNFSLTVGCRYKFWSSQTDWLLKYEVKGFTEASESNNDQLLYSSRIQNKGVYAYFGLKYTLPLGAKQ